ncbi:rhodanese-like domain-containing protein [Tamlana sp. 2_MG-2023]|uniref:rhodanese-like domain-containing protein n=1 Tax=unclassified Tamlana TaxID=2614803 RepID=UPI0026E12FD1|nr:MULTISPECIES: rhodanese-like domain-containing protein [unclassified Tamlana]MDO6758655.1 rhodanese-like domain-containing protein [Tamlana sp. 2_MG-2023]MDO6789354.1 rhodanese-like domain-containing protein [Tamlana sp. 1_MG-2023]
MKYCIHCLFIFFAFASCNQSASDDYMDMSVKQFKTDVSHDFVQLIDVRTPEEFKEGHLENAINVDFKSSDFTDNIEKLNSDKPVYIYCRSGNRSKKSVSYFKKVGFTTIYNLKGGILAWKAKDLPVVK